MGMGEPLDNFDEVIKSVEILNDNRGAGIGIRHITVSTCGLPDAIERLADAAITPRLAVSLNAADDDVRTRLMKIAKKYPLKKLMAALRNYQKKNRRRITFEYCMIEGINDSDQQAKKLLNLLKGLMANVNLIEFNPFEGCRFVPSSPQRISGFASILQQGGLETVIRYKRGQKIRAACGQLGADWLGKES
jgi:23S rRNA (adenine2503-C2)-methyltransferase